MENTMFLGSIEPGGYQTFDPMFMPYQSGPVTIDLSISYTDDFNQLQSYKASLEVVVEDAMPMPEPFPMLDEFGNPVLDEEGNPIMIDRWHPSPTPVCNPLNNLAFHPLMERAKSILWLWS